MNYYFYFNMLLLLGDVRNIENWCILTHLEQGYQSVGNFLCTPSWRLLFYFFPFDSFKSVIVSSWFYSEQKAKLGGFLDKNKHSYFLSACIGPLYSQIYPFSQISREPDQNHLGRCLFSSFTKLSFLWKSKTM